jgi:hypothetical protein
MLVDRIQVVRLERAYDLSACVPILIYDESFHKKSALVDD